MALIKTFNPRTKRYETPPHIVWTPQEVQSHIESTEKRLKAVATCTSLEEVIQVLSK